MMSITITYDDLKIISSSLTNSKDDKFTQSLDEFLKNKKDDYYFYGYEPYKGDIPTRTKGALVSMEKGPATGYALDALQPRGVLFVRPGDPIYEGMIIGEHSRGNDLTVNPCKGKKLTNMRASGSDDSVKLAPPRIMDLETCIEWIRPDELIEVTPGAIRLRKKILRASLRK